MINAVSISLTVLLFFPGEVLSPEVAEGRGLGLVDISQMQEGNDAVPCQVIVLSNPADQIAVGHFAGLEGFHGDTDRLVHTDGIGELDFTAAGKAVAEDVFCDLPRHIGTGAIHLRGILAGEGSAAMTAGTAVGISDDLPASHTGVGKAAAVHESTGGVDQEAEVLVLTVLPRSCLHHIMYQLCQVGGRDVGHMLCADEEGVDAVVLIVIGDLGLCVGEQRGMIRALQNLDGLGGQGKRQGQHFRSLLAGIAEHHALIAGTLPVYTLSNVRTLPRDVLCQDEAVGDLRLMLRQLILHDGLVVRDVPGSDLTGESDMITAVTIIILLITCAVYTYAVLHGFKGISFLAKLCIYLFFGLQIIVLLIGGQGRFIIENGVQSLGKMFQEFIGLSTYMDPARTNNFPQDWTIYYWAYWMVWCIAAPFFIGNISRGRTIKQTILGGYIFGVGSTISSFVILGNYSLGLQTKGAADFIAMYNQSGDLYELIINIMKTMPGSTFILILTMVCMIAFYATSFDSIAYTAACYSYKKLGENEKPHTAITLLWCLLLIVLPIALVFSESSMNNIQSVSIISAFPIGIIMIIMIWSFIKDAKKYMVEKGIIKE